MIVVIVFIVAAVLALVHAFYGFYRTPRIYDVTILDIAFALLCIALALWKGGR